MAKSSRFCGFCGTFTDVETIDNPEKKTQVMTCTKCNKEYNGIIMDKKTISPKYLWDKVPREELDGRRTD